jgi:2-polyprenyl-6-hydroxyphenyl methylase/3-demethylubiquinone-9 3-methyltransferase
MIELAELNELNNSQVPSTELKRIDQEISRLLSQYTKNNSPSLEQMWEMMDSVWDEMGCDNQNFDIDKINKFYQHPVWTLTGLFIEQDEDSLHNRQSICNWIKQYHNDIKTVIDYGAGMATLAKILASSLPNLSINLYEPYPSQIVLARLSPYHNIQFVNQLKGDLYDCLISTDVLEHVPDPLSLLSEMINQVKPNGYLIIANCFYPVIKCHLPCTFHLRYTFNLFTRFMGLQRLQTLNDHIHIYQKYKMVTPNWQFVRFLEKLSKILYQFLEIIRGIYHQIKKFQ